MHPRLSVIIPTLNCLPYLPAAIGSVRRQAVGSVEIIVVDDGSQDGTPEWLAAEALRDPSIRPVYRDGLDRGPAAARNAAVAVARAPILAFLDADDTWQPGALLDRLELHERRPEAVLSFANFNSMAPEGACLGTSFDFWPRFRRWLGDRSGLLNLGDRALAMLYMENFIGTSTVLAARDAVLAEGGFRVERKVCEDWDMWLRLARRGEVWCSTRVAANYLVRHNSASRDISALLAHMRTILEEYASEAVTHDPTARRIARAELAIVQGEEARAKGHKLAALGKHLTAFALDPSPRSARLAAYDAARLVGLK